ncbi:MAG: hypothetical protein HKN72_06305 [Gemmatimonadetes bacterium]|nr:hypothetical protein [Gemmatimonadota bacterium]
MTASTRGGTGRPFHAAVCVAVVAATGACGSSPQGDPQPVVSPFAEGQLVRASVRENVTACEVDAVCYLVLQYSDTTIMAIYGTGERPAPPCSISVETSDVAFGTSRGDVVQVRVSECEGEGLFIEEIRP